jgi:hypothetical protein
MGITSSAETISIDLRHRLVAEEISPGGLGTGPLIERAPQCAATVRWQAARARPEAPGPGR